MAESGWQKLSIAVAAPLIAGSIMGIYIGQGNMNDKMDMVNARQAVIQSQVSDMRAAVHGFYTQTEAKKDFAAVWATDKDQYSQIKDLIQRMRQVEMYEARGRHH